MENKIDRSQPEAAIEQMPDHRLMSGANDDQENDDQGLIILPAIKAKAQKPTSQKPSASHDEAKNEKNKQAVNEAPKEHDIRSDATSSAYTKPVQTDQQSAREYLPEYRSQTNGLRELLSTIDPDNRAGRAQGTSPKTSFEAQLEANLIENAMHLPHSRPGLPGSPDLPIGPTRWAFYLSGMIGGLAFLFVSALAYSHISSPTGIDWTKAKTGTIQFWNSAMVLWSSDKANSLPVTQTAKISLPEPLYIDKVSNETLIATSSRISTTAATPKKGSIKTPFSNEIFVSQKELEDQILALESKQTSKRNERQMARVKRAKTTQIIAQNNKTTNEDFIHGKSANFDQLVVIPSTKIDPDMENQMFDRARSYLQQHDISSARMILQYAASLGSGPSAMALAETFDPNYATTINFPNVNSSRLDARKWYYMASRLGVKEAGARLTALK